VSNFALVVQESQATYRASDNVLRAYKGDRIIGKFALNALASCFQNDCIIFFAALAFREIPEVLSDVLTPRRRL
jgi:hypothetical protein